MTKRLEQLQSLAIEAAIFRLQGEDSTAADLQAAIALLKLNDMKARDGEEEVKRLEGVLKEKREKRSLRNDSDEVATNVNHS